MEGLIEGRIVHYVLVDGVHRPAIVVNTWDAEVRKMGIVQLQVFVDGTNDLKYGMGSVEYKNGIIWKTSVHYDDVLKPAGTWHWIEKE
jgi:hypothetical protein